MRVKYLKLKNWLLLTVMGALGLTGCHCHKKMAEQEVEPEPIKVEDRGDVRLMYGVPTMNFMIRGQVRDADGIPVRGIKVNMLENGMTVEDGELQGDPERVREWLDGTSVTTDKSGHFVITNMNGRPMQQVRLLVRDVDGSDNGAFRDQVVDMEVTSDNIDRTSASGWHQGTYQGNVDIRLENK